MPVHLTSNYSKNFNYEAGKCQVSKDPDSGYGPLVFISGLGDPPPFQLASIAGSSPKERVQSHPQPHKQCYLLDSVNGKVALWTHDAPCAMAFGQKYPIPGSAYQLLQIPASSKKQNPISQVQTGSSGTQEVSAL